ncbi:GNAT family N-acetyltransferase [Caproiciproducens faecalis]|uniref:GNAT family N-acetyltransferase n=1 Tax=Caproiciproducens faecalis TaxID=2820301 RepID=A0ABS7DQB6_9FIRM|nr:GNAT family N-acetyltransferase [Caproiciproducens faecalis]MBW7573306.1 GNAT family N-acetyltransferase [Caproiciproducens faecalis]
MICFANWEMRGELAEIWTSCFHEPVRPAKYFLNNYFKPENCLVYKMGDKTASVVYLLPARILVGSVSVQAHYIYAAATLPQFRGHGYMAALLAAAALVGANRGDQYSAVLPAEPELYSLYEKAEYTKFFQVKNVSLSLEDLCSLADSGVSSRTLLTYSQMNSLRGEQLEGKTGSVLWSDEAFAFAAGMGKIYGDKMVCSRTGGKFAYALCRRTDTDTCAVLEMMADSDTLRDLAANIISAEPAERYTFRLPVWETLLGQQGEPADFGMLKPLGGAVWDPLRQNAAAPYLGLPLD